MSDATTTPTPSLDPAEATPRSTAGVLAIVGAIILLVVVMLLAMLFIHGGGPRGAADATADVRSNRVQAVYMTNDRVFFGDLEAGSGDWLRLKKAYFLRRSATDQAKAGTAATTDLVPVQQEVGGDGDLLINAKEVVLVQNLTAASAIAGKIDDAR